MPDDDLESVARVARQVRTALESADLTTFGDLLTQTADGEPSGLAIRPT